jgi:hypothetical protein
LVFVGIVYRGDRLLKAKNKLDKQMEDLYGPMSEIIDNLSYQGGFPPMPKPSRLNLGLTESELVLFDKAGNNGRIDYGDIRKLDKFTTKHERERKLPLMAYGPIAMVFNKPTFRHYFTMEYVDVNKENNNIVFMVGTREIAEELYKTVKSRIKQKKKK